jgi:uncharacterized membrane protein
LAHRLRLGFAGVLLVVQPQAEGFNRLGMGVPWLAPVLHALRDVSMRFVPSHIPSLVVALCTATAATLMAGMWSVWQDWAPMSMTMWSCLGGAAVCVEHRLLCLLIQSTRGRMTVVAPFRYVGLLTAVIMGFVVWGDIPNAMAWTGMVLLGGGCRPVDVASASMSIKSLPLSRWQAFVFWFRTGLHQFWRTCWANRHHARGVSGSQTLDFRKAFFACAELLHAFTRAERRRQLATYLGWLMHKTWGGIVAGVLFVWPSLCILTALSWVYIEWGEVTWVAGLLRWHQTGSHSHRAVLAQRIGARVLKNKLLWSIALVSFFLVFVFNTPFPWVVVSAAFMGFLGDRFRPEHFI